MPEDKPVDFPLAFAEQTRRTPCAPCILWEDETWTYQEIDFWANRVAHWLHVHGYAPGSNVGMCLDRSAAAIAIMIGVMRAGSAFVPLDPEYPRDRLQFMVNDAQIGIIFCDPAYRSLWSSDPKDDTQSGERVSTESVGAMEDSLRVVEPGIVQDHILPDSWQPSAIESESLAYIMYTSGSTGMPKGVQIEHRSMMAYCWADVDVYQLQPTDRTLQFSTLNFDIAIEEIFPPLLVGSAVVVRPRERSRSENELSALVDHYRISALHLATAYWHEWVDLMAASGQRVPRSLRMVLATGEKVSPSHYAKWLSLCDHSVLWCNAYGPTETTVTATVFIPGPDWNGESMPIGKPLPGYEAWILGAQDQPLGVGETGDLYIGGPALARGYLNRPEKNAEAFRYVDLPGLPQHRLYKTGDLARWLPSGDIEFAGRIDHQIKLGSYRIEPGEIEFHLASCPGVLDSLVVCEEVAGQRMLIAYIATGEQQVKLVAIADHLRSLVPSYMMPARYCTLASFPKTINGKIDRRALPPASQGVAARDRVVRQPRTTLERLLVTIWCDVLGLAEVGIDDDFFALGGSSLLVTRVIARIRQHYDLAIPVRDFFANPTIASIASQLQRRLGGIEAEGGNGSVDQDAESRELRRRLPIVHPFFFQVANRSLFAVHYAPPDGAQHVRSPAVLICGSLGHEYPRAHRNLQQLAVQLAQRGCHVLRFDYSGCGNSEEACEGGSVDAWCQEIEGAVAELQRLSEQDQLAFVGVRVGAALGAQTPTRLWKRMVLWDPVCDGSQWLALLDNFHQQALMSLHYYGAKREAKRGQLFGLCMSPQKEQGLGSLRIEPFLQRVEIPVLVIGSDRYWLHQTLPEGMSNQVRVVNSGDAIRWDEAQYTESAFSSPCIQQEIVAFITAGAT